VAERMIMVLSKAQSAERIALEVAAEVMPNLNVGI
jgi:hypothetical protein